VNAYRCAECGFDNTTMSNAELVDAIAAFTVDERTLTDHRPSPGVWSPREYAWHMASVFDFYGGRIEQVLTVERPQLYGVDYTRDPTPAPMPDATAVVTRLRALTPEQWQRVGIGSTDGALRDIRNLASRLAHECVHHTLDMARSS
jgi:hypothetical protein